MSAHMCGLSGVNFPYPGQNWSIRIIGGVDKDGNIVDVNAEKSAGGFSPELRREISGIPENVELVSQESEWWATVGVPFKSDEAPITPTEYVPLDADGRWTSELTMSPDEILDVVDGPRTERKEALVKAISEKDWETARRLLKQRH